MNKAGSGTADLPVTRFLSDFEVLDNKRNVLLGQDSNPGPLACEASVLTTQPRPLLRNNSKT